MYLIDQSHANFWAFFPSPCVIRVAQGLLPNPTYNVLSFVVDAQLLTQVGLAVIFGGEVEGASDVSAFGPYT